MHMVRKTNPAVRALREAHDSFRKVVAQRGETTHICYDSDLRHDERAIAKMGPSEPFVWLIGNMSTHMAHFPDPVDCYVATRNDWERLSTLRSAGNVLEVYSPRTLDTDGMRAYVWDGTVLHRGTSTDALWVLMCRVARERAVRHLQSLYTEAREDLAAARSFNSESWTVKATNRIAGIDRDMAVAQEWGNV